MRCAGTVGADQDLPVERLRVELREREIQHGLVIGGGVRAGVPRPQDPGGRLAGPVEIAQQRTMAVALKFPAAFSFSELALVSVASAQNGCATARASAPAAPRASTPALWRARPPRATCPSTPPRS